MAKPIIIDPVTRIEGHAKITVHLDDVGQVSHARFHVAEFRGFEKFCEGRPVYEMPAITARICGICPISHLLASAKAGDDILAVEIPATAQALRRLMNLGQIVQSHALSFFHLSAPDLLLGFDAPVDRRNVFGLMAANADLARRGIRLRQFGQEVIELLGGRKIHPSWAVPGGVREPLSAANRDRIRERLPEAFATATAALDLFKGMLGKFAAESRIFGNFPSLFLGLVGEDGRWEHYGGVIRLADGSGNTIEEAIPPRRYQEFIGEATEDDSYLKSPFYRPLGYPDGMYRVGPLARLNLCDRFGTARADRELAAFKSLGKGAVNSSFLYHYARLIEILGALEQIEVLLADPILLDDHLRADAGINRHEGVGVSEAPRGTLFHHYQVDDEGLITGVNLIIATGQNNLAMNRTVTQIARHYLKGDLRGGTSVPEPMLNRIEAGIRAYDPCLSCSTHALGQMGLHVAILDAAGQPVAEVVRH